MHPCIRQTCLDFYYESGRDTLANDNLEAFKDSIPEHAVAIVATCVGFPIHQFDDEAD